jgi:hypothetical protein
MASLWHLMPHIQDKWKARQREAFTAEAGLIDQLINIAYLVVL